MVTLGGRHVAQDQRGDVVALRRALREGAHVREDRLQQLRRRGARMGFAVVMIRSSPYSSPSADSASDTPSLNTISQSPGASVTVSSWNVARLEQADDRSADFEAAHALPAPMTSGGLCPALQ